MKSSRDYKASSSTLRLHMTGSEWASTVPGGLNRYFSDLYRALNRRSDIEVSAVAFGNPEPGGQSWGRAGGSTLRRCSTAYLDHAVLPRRAVIDRHFCLYGRQAITPHRKHPLVVHFHGPWADESRVAGSTETAARAKYLIERVRYAGADRVIVLSEHFRTLLIENYAVPAARICVIPPGVDLDRFRSTDRAQATPVVLCVRRLERRMGIHVLIRSWQSVSAAYPDARLVIVGTGSEGHALRSQAAESACRGSISFAGHATDRRLARLYEQAAITVIPSIALEGFGLCALESLASGRAPIVTDCGGLPDSVRELDPSLIVPAGDADALGDRIVCALHGRVPEPQQCRARAESFSWNAASERHIAMYEEIGR